MKTRHRIWNAFLKQTYKLRLFSWSQTKLLVADNPSLESKPLRYRHREFLESCLPSDFTPTEAQKISACIVSSLQEIDLLPLSTEAILKTHDGMIQNCFLISPREQMNEIKKVIPSEFKIIADEDLLSIKLIELVNQNTPKERRGWIKQQLLKILAARHLGSDGTLLVDADTILLRPQTWLSPAGVQNLQLSIEYHYAYQQHYEKFMFESDQRYAAIIKRPKVSFVTHHQLMQSDVLDRIFAINGRSFEQGLEKWLKSIDFASTNSPACEWHTYGTFLTTNYPSRVHLTKWNNLGISRKSRSQSQGREIMNLSVQELFKEFSGYNTLSLHHYIKN